ncbi:hypothetical protein CPHO_09580 [Corynebacterium phocae]|uniref:DNA-directed RNA polymerase II n=1 Tax=Corynebacterium phocae TaxID=161895 RepID=A0A1L7D4I9_9CORY|nr:hypothetical protein [Corynebacterium phocae]APT93096.1 hypothetical protein CPHO_09580 [Corynebacterium phocae]KAA8722399.1 hypothetical protein F4V58_09055 [Corynebacterium phocae]
MKADTGRVLAFIALGFLVAAGVGVTVWRTTDPATSTSNNAMAPAAVTVDALTPPPPAKTGGTAQPTTSPGDSGRAPGSLSSNTRPQAAAATNDPHLAPNAVVHRRPQRATPTVVFRPENLSASGKGTHENAPTQPPAARVNPETRREIPAPPLKEAKPPVQPGLSSSTTGSSGATSSPLRTSVITTPAEPAPSGTLTDAPESSAPATSTPEPTGPSIADGVPIESPGTTSPTPEGTSQPDAAPAQTTSGQPGPAQTTGPQKSAVQTPPTQTVPAQKSGGHSLPVAPIATQSAPGSLEPVPATTATPSQAPSPAAPSTPGRANPARTTAPATVPSATSDPELPR